MSSQGDKKSESGSSNNLLQDIKRLQTMFKPKRVREAETYRQKIAKQIRNLSAQKCERNLSRSNSSSQSNEGFGSRNKQEVFDDESSKKKWGFCRNRFTFPLKDIQLSNKRIQIFSGIIKEHDGVVVELKDCFVQGVDFVIVSESVNKRTLLQSLEREKNGKKQTVKFKKILRFRYIIDCQKLNKKLPTDQYEIVLEEVKNPIQERQSEYFQKVEQIEKRKFVHMDPFSSQSQSQYVSDDQTITMSVGKVTENKTKKEQFFNFTEKKEILPKRKHEMPHPWLDKQKFLCQKGSSQLQFPMNQFIYSSLMELYAIYESQKDTGRKIAYLKAASAVKSFNKEISSQKDIMQMRGVGKQIRKKIGELFETGKIQKLQRLKGKQQNVIIQDLTRVWGIGVSKAKQLISKGIKCVQDLKNNQQSLNKNQKIGLKYLQEFQKRIPRDKVTQMLQYVKQALFLLVNSKQLHTIEACGSYRRGKETCGDIDIIITRKDGVYQPDLIIDLITFLERKQFLTDHLSIPSLRQVENKSISYMGVCQMTSSSLLPQCHHRMDIKYYPVNQFAFAVLYFTGSDMFNRSMRLFARKKGLSLSDHGLIPVQREGQKKVWKGEQISIFTQKGIFQFLGLDWKQPSQRDL